jgi:chromate transporter
VVLYEEKVVQRRGWLREGEFQEILTVAQIFPGPSLVNLSAALGYRLFGLRAAALGVLALCFPGAVMAILVAAAVPLDHPDVRELMRGFAFGSLLLLARFLLMLARGMGVSGRPRPLLPLKWCARWGLAVVLVSAGVSGAPVPTLLAAGLAAAWALEAALP